MEQCDGKDTFLQALIECLLPKVKKCFEQAGSTGTWITTIPDQFSRIKLTKTEWFDSIALRYGSRPPSLPSHCNGCGEGFTIKHALNCKKGGLVGIHHDDAHNKWAHLCSLAFSNARVEYATLSSPPHHCLTLTPWGMNQGETSLCTASGNAPEAPYLTSTSVTLIPDLTPTPPPKKCWSVPPRRRTRSMNRPVSPNVKTLLRLCTWRTG
ncbi:hypothetical protein ACHAW6_003900 [Cyclotella cf. meneghiniana]